ncbi:MAG: hypothetical protein WCI05_06750, partial [Myxococcales bacterium]
MADPREPGSGDPSFPVTEEAIATRAAELRQAVEAGTHVDWAREFWLLLEKHQWLAGRLAWRDGPAALALSRGDPQGA